MQASDFQATAERLALGVTEGDWRSAISRAYYAVFHYFRELFLAHGLDLGQGGGAHHNLYVGLHNCGIPGAAGFGGAVDDLRRYRVTADYNFAVPVAPAHATTRVQESRQLVADFQVLLVSIPA